MKNPFEDPALVRSLANQINKNTNPTKTYTFMEVCGTHTQEIGKWALRSLLPKNIRLISGPGCPVCVTPGSYIDNAARMAVDDNVIIATFGDLVRVPGNETSLEYARSLGARIEVVYSPLEAITLASKNPDRQVVFLAVGFETTIAAIAASIRQTAALNIKNLSFYTSLRLVPPALVALLTDPDLALDGFILPGHVSAVIGTEPYKIILDYSTPGTVAGFDPIEILMAVNTLITQVNEGVPSVMNNYRRAVKPLGNETATRLFASMFEVCDQEWRGIGTIPFSGYKLNKTYEHLNSSTRFDLSTTVTKMPPGCSCGSVLKGIITPSQCPLFGKGCNPNHPIGPCMVSNEGSCAAAYKYGP